MPDSVSRPATLGAAAGAMPARQRLGRFELLHVLGRGAQATVWLARDTRLHREVAVKWLADGGDAQAQEQWLREARHVGRLSHPRIVPVFEADVHEGQPYLVFEYVAGCTLAEHLAHQGRCAVHDAVELMVDVLEGLQAAHEAGIVHCDLKPSNVMVDAQRHARIMDFGIAAAMASPGGGPVARGTPAYMAPEAVAGAAPAPASDIYAAALVLVELLTGRRLITERDPAQALAHVARHAPQLPDDLGAGVDDGLRSILRRALARDPAERYASAQDMCDALRAWAAPVSAPTAASNAALDFLLRRMRHKSDFPALSDSVARIQRMTHSEDDSIADLTNEILKSVALTNKLLRLVNSAPFSHLGGGIGTVSRAVSLVGFNAVRNMALSLVLLEHMQDRGHAKQMREEFLRTMMAGAVAAQLCGPSDQREEAFLGAMFQGLGRMLCSFYFPEEAARIRALVASDRPSGGDEAAALQVLGLSLEDLGVGVARVWSLPDSLQRCIRPPQGRPPQRPPEGVERLRWVGRAANQAATIMLQHDPEPAGARLQQLAAHYAVAFSMTQQEFVKATVLAREQLIAMADALDLRVDKGSPAARLLAPPAALDAPPVLADPATGHELHYDALQTLPLTLAQSTDAAPSVSQAAEVLAAGIQEVSNAMVEDFRLNDIVRMVLETMLRALGARRIVFCLREVKTERMTGRFGLGEGSADAVRALAVPLKDADDLFAAVCQRGADTLIADATEERVRARLPAWFLGSFDAASFLLLPLSIKQRPFALIYADHERPGGLVVDDKVQGQLRTLRNQLVLAFRQAD
ncbi:protein kinase domain-containing protein [Diaphorobacter nitroreducens]|uniref:protein kinase domain-containing protein n=1 Tax=Diaphorobacter nitroreducens TaxID=164759 RepID=UPI0028A07A36|nr:HDOD domain-containing protein [Diaphorobacter nitroreducens]